MSKKLRFAIFKLVDILVILTMVLASPMSISAAALSQDNSPTLETDKSEYAPGESARVNGSGFAVGEYVLAAEGPDGTSEWAIVNVDDSGVFVSESPELDSDGTYKVRAYASGWNGEWAEEPVASTDFTVTAPPPPTEVPTEPPTEEPTNTPTEEPTAEPTITPTEEPTLEPTATDQPTNTPEPTDEPTAEPTPAATPTIESGQADYPQGALVILTGSNWQGDSEVRIIVNDDIGQTWRRDITVPASADGTISDSFNLPNYFVATFSVVARGLQTGRVVTTSFTDAPKITAKTHQGQEKPAGTYTSGNVTTYQEGDYINFRFTLESNEASSGQLQVRFTGDDSTCLFFDGSFNLGTYDNSAPAIQTISGATPTVTTVGAPVATSFGTSNGEWVQTLNITFSGAGEAVVNYYIKLSDQAGECNGSSQHSRLNAAGGDVGQSGQQNVPVPANQIVELPEITVTKKIDRDGDSTFESTAAAGEFCFRLDGGTCVSTNSSGQVIFTNVTPNGAHTITETQLNFGQGTYSFVSGSGTNCTFSGSTATATVTSGTTSIDAACTFNNAQQKGTITITKDSVPNDPQDFSFTTTGTGLSSFSLDDDPDNTLSNTQTFTNLNPGTYSVTEGTVTGWSLTGLTCTDPTNNTTTNTGTRAASINLGAGETVTCTFTNTLQQATLIVQKVVVNDNGGIKVASDFSFRVNGGSAVAFEGDGQNDLTVSPGTYSVAEPAVSGYSTTYNNCSNVTVPPGGSATCTITNNDQPGTLIVKKVVVNDNGGTATASSFSFSVNGDAAVAFEPDGQNDLTVNAGTYTVTEPSVAGYSTTYSNCANVAVPNGGSATCTITNNDQAATLIVKKVVINNNGGALEADDFSFSVNAGTAIPFEEDGQNEVAVSAGTYTVTEPAASGYTTTYDNCSNLVIPNGGTATCTITNDDQPGTLIVKKVVVNDNGGTATAASFSFSVNDGSPVAFEADGQNEVTVSTGTYTVTEPPVAGYSTSYDNCTDLVIPNGGSATCTVTNNDQAATLIVKKVVVNDNGGSLTAASFSFSVNGGTAVVFEADGQNDLSVNAGTYSITEPAVTGYTTTYDNCSNVVIPNGGSATCTITNNDQPGTLIVKKVVLNDNGGSATADDFSFEVNDGTAVPFEADGQNDLTVNAGTYTVTEPAVAGYTTTYANCSNLVIPNGGSATCTITNDDVSAHLTLVKVVVNDNGGTAAAGAWTLSAAGPTPLSGAGGANGDVDAGTYTLSESAGPAGYTASAWSCTGGSQSGSQITLANGESATCTITNDDQTAHLKLVKVVVNDNGGTATAASFTLSASGPTPISGAGGATSDETFDAGTYDLSETNVPGYTAGNWVCEGGTQDDEDTVIVGLGESAVCTITNDDQAPSLTLVKEVTTNDGGNEPASEWTLTATGPTGFSGPGPSVSNGASFDAGTYALSENGPAGYTASAWSCTGGTQDGSNITVGLGESATCTIVNDDNAPTLKLIKTVVNNDGGNAVVSDFPLFIDDTQVTSGTANTLQANVLYTASETNQAGYTASTWGGDCNADGTITLEEGQNAVCTITNDDVAPTLKLVKNVVNNNGGNAVADNWTLSAAAGDPFDERNFSNPGGSGDFETVFANQEYDLSETTLPGYTASAWSCDSGSLSGSTVTLAEGENVTCTITNDDTAPTLTLIKTVINDDGGNAQPNDFNLTIGGSPATSGTPYTLDANKPYALNETLLDGYTFVEITGDAKCPEVLGGTVALDEGENITCTITNDDVAPTLTLIKTVINDNGGNAQPDDFNLTIGGNPATSGVAYPLDANKAYAINETQLAGYSFVSITGDPKCPAVLSGTVTLDEGENVTCTITNNDQPGTLIVKKALITDNGSLLEVTDFEFSVNGEDAIEFEADAQNEFTVNQGTYTVVETAVPGFTTTYDNCDAVFIPNGGTQTCTITNNDQPATLIVIKHVVNDNGGTAVAGDFTLDSGGTDDTPSNFDGEESPGTMVTLDAGTYNVTETGLAGYNVTFSADCTGTLANGETKTCTVTNNDIQPQLVVIKHVINDNGGTATAGSFTMNVTGTNVSLATFAGAEAPGTNVALDAGSYEVHETSLSGYAPTFSADCTGSIAIGETKTCTVTNDDISPMLTVVKVLLPGDDTGLFNLQIDGITRAADVGDGGTTSAVEVDAGSHTVGETAGTGTSLSDYVSTVGGDCAADGTISLALADNKTCTITNVRRGSIVIIKNALGGDGTFNFTSSTLGNFSLTTNNGTASTTFSGLNPANTYNVAETVPAGWELNSATCNSGEVIDSIDLDPGETVTCTFENEKAGSIVIVKNTVGGDGTFNFTSSTLGNFSLTTASNTASTTFSNLDVDLTYDVAETVPAGWDMTSATCNSGETTGSINLDPGETVTCTFTNTKRGHIIVDKVTLPSGDPASFTFTTTGTNYTGFNLTDAAAPNDQTLVPGTYSVAETALAGWDLTGLSCTDPSGAPVISGNTATINLAAGETVTCTFTNTKRGSIKIIKDAVPNDAQDFAFTRSFGANFSLDDDSNSTLQNNVTFSNLVPGAYSVTEGAVAGWDLTGLTCNDANGTTNPGTRTANIALDPGENVICTFTNTKRGTIIVEKQTNPNGAPGSFTFTGTAAGTISDNGTITVANLVPGTYTSTEANPAVTLFALTSIVCNDGSSANPSTGNLTTRTSTFKLDPGETVRCVFTNTKDYHPGTIGFWKNWRNHYTSSQFQLLINYLKANNPKIYNKDLVSNSADDLTIAKHDAIMNVGSATPREQMILAQFTALKFNLAITQLQGTGGLVQKNDNLCLAGKIDVSGISGATAFFGTSTPTIQQVVNAVESKWTGKLTTNRADWKWNLTNAQKDMLINVITGINEGTLVMSSGCP